MKFWQLVSVCRECPDRLEEVLRADKWKSYCRAYLDFGNLVNLQRRDVLDQIVPDELVVSALQHDTTRLYLSAGHLRCKPLKTKGELELTKLDVYQRFGGEVLENVFEKGLVQVETC